MNLPLFFCLIGLVGPARGQAPAAWPLDPATHRIRYAAVVPVAGARQADLLARARGWATGFAALGQPAVLTHAPDTEVLIVSGTQPFAYSYALAGTATRPALRHTTPLVPYCTATLSLREGRYRYEVTDFVFAYPTARPPSPARLPAEAELIEAFAITEDSAQGQTAIRMAFREATATLLTHLQDAMSKPLGASATK